VSNNLTRMAEESVRSISVLFFGDAFSALMLAIGSMLIARFLGPADYGLYTLCLTIPPLLVSLTSLSAESALIRFSARLVAQGKRRFAARFLRSVICVRLLISAIILAAVFFFSDFFATFVLNRPETAAYVRLSSLAILFMTLYDLLLSAFVGLSRAKVSAVLKSTMSIAKSLLAPLLIVLGYGMAGAVFGYVLGYVLAGVIGVILLNGPYRTLRQTSIVGSREDGFLECLKLMFSFSIPNYLSFLLITFAGQFRLILPAYYSSNIEIGNLYAAANLAVMMDVLVAPMTLALFPAFSRLDYATQQDELRDFFALSIKYTSLLLVPASVAVIVLSKDLTHLVYGQKYELAPVFLAMWMMPSLLTGIGSHVLGSLISGGGKTKLNLQIGLVEVLVFLVTGPCLTGSYGIPGLIFAVFASKLASVVHGLRLAKRRLSMRLDSITQLKIYATSIVSVLPSIMLLCLFDFGPFLNAVLGGSIYTFFYFTALPLFHVIRPKDVENIKGVLGRVNESGVISVLLEPIFVYEGKLTSIFSSGEH